MIMTPYDLRLHMNVKSNNLLRVQQLLTDEPTIDVNEKDTFLRTPLHLAFSCTANFNIEIIDVLLKHKSIDVNIKNCYGETPLESAIKLQFSNDVIILNILKLGYEIDQKFMINNLPLYYKDNPDTMKKILSHLVEHKFDINGKNDDKNTILYLAFKHENPHLIKALLAYANLNVNLQESYKLDDDKRILHFICIQNLLHILYEIINRKIELNSTSLDLTDNEGNTALHYCQSRPIFQALIKYKPNINLQNLKRKTPFHYHLQSKLQASNYCSLTDHQSLTNLMLRNGAYLDYQNDKTMLLNILQFYRGHTKMRKLLAFKLILHNNMDLKTIIDDCYDDKNNLQLHKYGKHFIEFNVMKMRKLYPHNVSVFDIFFYYEHYKGKKVVDWSQCNFRKLIHRNDFKIYYYDIMNKLKSIESI